MPKKVFANVVDHRVYDDGVNIEDVTSITLPDLEFTKTEFDVAGMVGKLNMANPAHLEAMSYTIAHNNGLEGERLATPDIHQHEFRLMRQNLDVPDARLEYDSVKYRLAGQMVKESGGSIERGNPLGSTVEYSCQRFIKEIAGKIVVHVDIPAGIVIINGVDYGAVSSILDG